MTDDLNRRQRMAFLGLIAWISLCLLVIGWGPPLGSNTSRLLACTGLVGLASAVGLAARVKREMAETRELLGSYMNEARTDPLTGLANRRALNQELERRIAQFQRQGTPLSLLLIDVDHFKRFNDSHGHQAGDEMLCTMARALRDTVRDMDLATRYGGEEFAIVLPGTPLNDAKIAAERVRRATAEIEFTFRGAKLRDTVSVGLAQAMEMDDPQSLLRRADDALYAAKEAGRNRSYFHDGEMCLPVRTTADVEPAIPAKC
ncbi:MAG: GGDEF domain-containing protein [Planctomycetes bacterium]|nr:GGDEF domain-containing protein [Planctomycetota bacterium]MBL7038086.1 GGDEF domain-containing protein [Pirellulaceae bacterium]